MTPDDEQAVEDALTPAKSDCLKCRAGHHRKCLWRTRPTSCGCACSWLVRDVQQQHPSLRETQ